MSALVLAGTQSGVGKTSVALGLCRALSRRGVAVQPAKVGPDYLDPTHLALAAGRECWNLDPWMMGADFVRAQAAQARGLLLVEGVMGLYDGADAAHDEGSTAHVARLLGAPAWLVVDAHGAARSFAAVVHGFASFPGAPVVAGVIANRSGTERHAAVLREALASLGLPPLVGAVPRGALPSLKSRHLGLVAADAGGLDAAHLEAMADAVERHLDLSGLPAAPAPEALPSPPPAWPVRRTLAVAWDAAFSFAYADLWPALAARGVAVRRFSPLADAAVPEADGLYLPGGYPEVHAGALAANDAMLASVRAFAAGGRPVYAECGGLMYLSEGIALEDGRRLAMAGVLPAWTRMLGRRKALGYAEVTLAADGLLGRAGAVLRGHEFHYSELEAAPAGWTRDYAVAYRRGAAAAEGWRRGRVLASYIHLHLASNPAALDALAAALEGPAC